MPFPFLEGEVTGLETVVTGLSDGSFGVSIATKVPTKTSSGEKEQRFSITMAQFKSSSSCYKCAVVLLNF